MVAISSAVGRHRTNDRVDVQTVQSLLNRAMAHHPDFAPLDEDGLFGPRTEAAIRRFQDIVLGHRAPDGAVDPNGPTLRLLGLEAERNERPRPHPVARKPAITAEDYILAGKALGCEAAVVEAVALTESRRTPFDGDGRPTILFERHKFHQFSGGRFDASDPDISNKTAGGYGTFADQYPRLERAMKLDEAAALKSCSWGRFQIMGFNHAAAGYAQLSDFVEAMKTSDALHLDAFVAFVKADPVLLRAIRAKDWTAFAARYNGRNYAQNAYDKTMRDNYERIVSGAL